MKGFQKLALGVSLLGILFGTGTRAAEQTPPKQRIEVAFVLDTTGSMADLIDGAKKKIWSIADEIRRQRPDAEIRFALVGYRDRGDLYVTDVTDLTDDLHGLYGKLVGYQADGGGDWPESVNEALSVAVSRLAWTRGEASKRMVYLVGDAPPHMDYVQDVAFTDTLKIAGREKIVVHAVQAGDAADTEVAWRSIASLGGGDYIVIPQSGNVAVIETPYDQDIQKLQLQLNLTVVPYGQRAEREAVEDKLKMVAEAPAPAASDMASYGSRAMASGDRKVVTGGGDLVADVLGGSVDAATLPDDQLPEDWKGLAPKERATRLAERIAERERLQKTMGGLVAKRDAWLAAKAAAAPEAGDSFDGAVKESLSRYLR